METLCPTALVSNSNSNSNSSWVIQQSKKIAWTKEENKRFESALAIFDEKTPNRWFLVAEMIPGKSVYDVINQYMELVADVSNIEAGLVPIPGYLASSFTLELPADHQAFDLYRKKPRIIDQERKKGVPWTEEEHRRFLLGLQKHGKGDWRNISRNFVISKTPTQVASHAQKYYLRQLSGGKDKRRPSIHDITTVHLSHTEHESCDDQLLISSCLQNDWNDGAAAALMVLDSACADSFLGKKTHCSSMFNINGASISTPGFYMKSPRFYG